MYQYWGAFVFTNYLHTCGTTVVHHLRIRCPGTIDSPVDDNIMPLTFPLVSLWCRIKQIWYCLRHWHFLVGVHTLSVLHQTLTSNWLNWHRKSDQKKNKIKASLNRNSINLIFSLLLWTQIVQNYYFCENSTPVPLS